MCIVKSINVQKLSLFKTNLVTICNHSTTAISMSAYTDVANGRSPEVSEIHPGTPCKSLNIKMLSTIMRYIYRPRQTLLCPNM